LYEVFKYEYEYDNECCYRTSFFTEQVHSTRAVKKRVLLKHEYKGNQNPSTIKSVYDHSNL
jgi:hypothetical protein